MWLKTHYIPTSNIGASLPASQPKGGFLTSGPYQLDGNDITILVPFLPFSYFEGGWESFHKHTGHLKQHFSVASVHVLCPFPGVLLSSDCGSVQDLDLQQNVIISLQTGVFSQFVLSLPGFYSGFSLRTSHHSPPESLFCHSYLITFSACVLSSCT